VPGSLAFAAGLSAGATSALNTEGNTAVNAAVNSTVNTVVAAEVSRQLRLVHHHHHSYGSAHEQYAADAPGSHATSMQVTRTQNKAALQANGQWEEAADAWLPVRRAKPPPRAFVAAVRRVHADVAEDAAGGIQAVFARELVRARDSCALEWTDTHKMKVVDDACPDFTACARDVRPDKLTAVAFVELKHASVDVDGNDALGQVADVLARVMLAQTARRHAACVVFNGAAAVEVVCEREPASGAGSVDRLVFRQSPTFVKDKAWRLVWAMLTAKAQRAGDVGAVTIEGAAYRPARLIGRGRCCSQFAVVTAAGTPCVLRKFDRQADREAEGAVLKLLAGQAAIRANVPLLLGENATHLLVRPLAKHFRHAQPRRFLARHAAELLAVLRCVHGLGLVHRDVRPGNVFLVVDTEDEAACSECAAPSWPLLLNDWADTAVLGQPTAHYTGAPSPFMAPWIEEALGTAPSGGSAATYTPRRCDDLYTFVVTCYAASCDLNSRSPQFAIRPDAMPPRWCDVLALCTPAAEEQFADDVAQLYVAVGDLVSQLLQRQ
jgi:hypothetical protein